MKFLLAYLPFYLFVCRIPFCYSHVYLLFIPFKKILFLSTKTTNIKINFIITNFSSTLRGVYDHHFKESSQYNAISSPKKGFFSPASLVFHKGGFTPAKKIE